MRFQEIVLRFAVAVALVAVAVSTVNVHRTVCASFGKVLVCRGVSMYGIAVLEVVTDSATVYASGNVLVPSGASAVVVYRDGGRFLVADGISYGSIFGISSLPLGKLFSPLKRQNVT